MADAWREFKNGRGQPEPGRRNLLVKLAAGLMARIASTSSANPPP
jgi:hypothetical protein